MNLPPCCVAIGKTHNLRLGLNKEQPEMHVGSFYSLRKYAICGIIGVRETQSASQGGRAEMTYAQAAKLQPNEIVPLKSNGAQVKVKSIELYPDNKIKQYNENQKNV